MVIKLGIVFSEGVVLEGLHDRDQRPSGRDDQPLNLSVAFKFKKIIGNRPIGSKSPRLN